MSPTSDSLLVLGDSRSGHDPIERLQSADGLDQELAVSASTHHRLLHRSEPASTRTRPLSQSSPSSSLAAADSAVSEIPQYQASQSSREPRPLSWASGGRRCLLGVGFRSSQQAAYDARAGGCLAPGAPTSPARIALRHHACTGHVDAVAASTNQRQPRPER